MGGFLFGFLGTAAGLWLRSRSGVRGMRVLFTGAVQPSVLYEALLMALGCATSISREAWMRPGSEGSVDVCYVLLMA